MLKIETNKSLILTAQKIAQDNRRLCLVDDLSQVEFSVFSQWGEDGIIDWLVSKLPMIPRVFVEFGVEDYREANTRLLLQMRNWRGLVIDGSRKNIKNILNQAVTWRYQLTARNEFITCENINEILHHAGVSGQIGILSIDIDGNDYWVWKAIDTVSPFVVVIEFNAVFGDIFPITVPYCPDFNRTKAHYSNLYFGASLPALIALGSMKGYTFVGTTSAGVNAFFVRDDVASYVVNSIRDISAYPSLLREARNPAGNLLYLNGDDRFAMIADCHIVNLTTGQLSSLRQMGEVYSSQWKISERIKL